MPHRPTILALSLIILATMLTLPALGWLLNSTTTDPRGSWSYVFVSGLILLLVGSVCLALPRFFRRR